jgi:hypothetical protein
LVTLNIERESHQLWVVGVDIERRTIRARQVN